MNFRLFVESENVENLLNTALDDFPDTTNFKIIADAVEEEGYTEVADMMRKLIDSEEIIKYSEVNQAVKTISDKFSINNNTLIIYIFGDDNVNMNISHELFYSKSITFAWLGNKIGFLSQSGSGAMSDFSNIETVKKIIDRNKTQKKERLELAKEREDQEAIKTYEYIVEQWEKIDINKVEIALALLGSKFYNQSQNTTAGLRLDRNRKSELTRSGKKELDNRLKNKDETRLRFAINEFLDYLENLQQLIERRDRLTRTGPIDREIEQLMTYDRTAYTARYPETYAVLQAYLKKYKATPFLMEVASRISWVLARTAEHDREQLYADLQRLRDLILNHQ